MSAPQLTSHNRRSQIGVSDAASVLKRFYFLHREMVLMQAGWLPGIQPWECKLLLPEIVWQDSLTLRRIRERVLELRFPERKLKPGNDLPLIKAWSRLKNSPDGQSFLVGSLIPMKRFLIRCYEEYLAASDKLDDGPSNYILNLAIQDLQGQISAIESAIELSRSLSPQTWRQADAWVEPLRLNWDDWAADSMRTNPQVIQDLLANVNELDVHAFSISREGIRDERFHRLKFAWPDRLDQNRPAGSGLELQLRVGVHHMNEVWASEMAAVALYELADRAPPEFVEEAARWCYDEIRHCRMGYSRLKEWGFEDAELPLDSFSYDASGEADPLVRLGTVYYFETTYIHTKSERTKLFAKKGDELSSHDMDFDWADELIHTHYGKKWLSHFIEELDYPRSMNDIKQEAEYLVHHQQNLASDADREATMAAYHQLLQRASQLAGS